MFPRTKLVTLFFSAIFVAYGLVGGVLDDVAARDGAYQDLTIFTDVLSKVKEDYVEDPDMEKAMLGALHGMMEALDPYSSFVAGKTYRELKTAKQRMTASPGIVLSKRYGYAHVVSTVPGSPAEEEGLRPGDLIESIEGSVTTQMSLWEARQMLTGPENSTVDVRLIRGRRSEPFRLRLLRKSLPLPQVSARIVEEGIGFLRIPHFQAGVEKEVSAKIKLLTSLGMEAMLIDVRGAALGDLEGAVAVSELFLKKGLKMVTVRGRGQSETAYVSVHEPIIRNLPLFVLIDGGTSGPAEVFAAALKDHSIGEMIGEKTNGQGSLQDFFHLDDGSVLQISTKLFYRASGELIQSRKLKDSGIAPDVRSPSQDFVTNLYFENAVDDPEASPGDDFYRKLNDSVLREQFEEGLRQVRKRLLQKSA